MDLEVLARLYPPSSDPTVSADAESYYLTSSSLPDGMSTSDSRAMYARAATLLRRANAGAWLLLNSGFRRVELTGGFWDPAEPEWAVVMATTPEERSYIPAPQRLPPTAPRWARLAEQHRDVDEVLALLNEPAWRNLYKVWEIVRDNVSPNEPSKKVRAETLKAQGFTDAGDLEALRDNSCNPAAAADEARHARWGGPPPTVILSLAEGQRITRELVTGWLNSFP